MSVLEAPTETKEVRKPSRRAPARKPALPQASNTRFFVGKSPTGAEMPEFERELPSEAEAVVAAFKADCRLFLVIEYTVAEKNSGGKVWLQKEAAIETVSNVNQS